MWKLLVVAAFVCAASAQRGGGRPDMAGIEQNLTALWARVGEMDQGSCRPQITLHLDTGKGGRMGGGKGGPARHEDGDDSSEHHGRPDGPEGSNEHHGRTEHGEDGSAHVHVHLHVSGMGMGMMGGKDIYHANTIPWAHRIPKDFVHAQCRLEGAVQGVIHMRQSFLGNGPVEMDFEVTGAGADAEHAFFAHRYGASDEMCGGVGVVFTPPHGRPGGMGMEGKGPGGRPSDADEPDVEAPNRARRSHHGRPGGRPGGRMGGAINRPEGEEGVLGSVTADSTGALTGLHEFETVTMIGAHSIIGRSLALHAAGDDGTSAPVACCVPSFTSGAHFGDEEPAWIEGEEEM